MDSRDMQVIGLCRFSYPAIGGFQVDHETPQDRADFLYAPERMEERFRTFEGFTLPPLRAQTDPNFTFVVLIGEDLPEHYRERLTDLLAQVPQARLLIRPPGPHRPVMREVIHTVREERKAPNLQFRMDDDDAVSVRFVERLREAAQDAQSLLRKHRHVGFDFNQGWTASMGPKGIKAQPTIEALWTAGLGMSARRGAKNTIMNFGHSKLARWMPVLTLPGEDMFLRGHNAFNDSRQRKTRRKFALKLLDTEGETHFRKTYNIDADHIRAMFS